MAESISVADAMRDAALYRRGAADASVAMKEQQDIITTAVKGAVESSQRIEEAVAITSRVKNEGKLRLEEANTRIGSMFKMNAQTGNDEDMSELLRLSKEKIAAGQEHSRLAQEIARKGSTNFFDSPLEYIYNKATIGNDIAQANYVAAAHNTANDQLASLNSSVQSTITTQNAMLRTIDASSLASEIAKDVDKAKIETEKLRISGAQQGMNAIQSVLAMSKEQLEASSKAVSIQQHERQLAISAGHLKLAQESHAMKMKELEGKAEYEERLADAFDKGVAAQGRPPMDAGSKKAALFAIKNGKAQEWMVSAMEAGFGYQSTGVQFKSPNVASMLQGMNSNVPIQYTEQEKPVQALAMEAARKVDAAQSSTSKDSMTAALKLQNPKDPAERRAKLQYAAQQIYIEQLKNGTSEIGRTTDMAQVFAKHPALQDTTVYKEVLKPVLDAGGSLTPAQSYKLVRDAVSSNKLTVEQAAELGTANHTAVLLVNSQQRLRENTGLSPSGSLPTNVNGRIIDLANKDVVTRELLRDKSMLQFREAAGNYGF